LTLQYFLDIVLYDGEGITTSILVGTQTQTRTSTQASPNTNGTFHAIYGDYMQFMMGLVPILGSRDISVMAQMMDPICKEQNTVPDGYRFATSSSFILMGRVMLSVSTDRRSHGDC
jgi:hypothetical protein